MLRAFLFYLVAVAVANPFMMPFNTKRAGVTIDTRTPEQIYEAAQKETAPLRVAWGGDTKISHDRITNAFQKAYPKIKLETKLDLSKYLDSQIDIAHETSGGKDSGADFVVLQSLGDFTRWADEGRLLNYKVAQWDDIYPDFVHPDGAYTGLFISTFGQIIYNPHKTDNKTLPTTFPDFLDSKYKGKLILTFPNDDDAILYLFKLIAEKYGFAFFQQLTVTQDVRWVRGSATPSLLIGELDNPQDTASMLSFASSNSFAPNVSWVAPQDTYMAWPQTGAILANARAPESAKLFMNYLHSDAWQAPVSQHRFSVRRAYDGAGIFKQKWVEPLGYVKFVNDRAEVEKWRFRFESVIGPPKGDNPTRVW